MPYKNQIIHLKGGINEYVGELDQRPHKMGPNWYRILNPCLYRLVVRENEARMHLIAIQGGNDAYKRWIDIRIPEDSIMEILTVDKEGDLFKAYEKESTRTKSKLIHMPESNRIVMQ